MKIIEKDFYNKLKPRLIASDLSDKDAKLIAYLYNNYNAKDKNTYYQVVSDEYKMI